MSLTASHRHAHRPQRLVAWMLMGCRAVGRAVVLMLAVAVGLTAQVPARDPSPHSDVTLLASTAGVLRGGTTTLAVRLTLDPRWHTYWLNPGDAGLPVKVKWTLPAGVTVGALQFPTPTFTPQPPLMSYGYEREVLVLAEVTVPASFTASSLTISGKADWLACAEICLPATGPLSLSLDVLNAPPAPSTSAPAIAAAAASVPVPIAGYAVHAWADTAQYIVSLVREGAAYATRFAQPYLFADSTGVVDHAAAQRVAQSGDTLIIAVPRLSGSQKTLTELSGIIATDIDATTKRSVAMRASLSAPVPPALRTAALALLTGARQVGGVEATPVVAVEEAGADMTLVAALLFAFIGGLLLNLMPCVFPVLSVKVLALLQHGGGADVSRSRRHGLAFGLGVLLSFWALAGLLIALRAGGESLGWGFQLQSPPVVAMLALLMFALALNLSGVFEIGLSLTRLGAAGSGGRYADSLLTGVLAVLVAAPCTAPFMGAALGYALVQPAIVALLVFTALGAGLALPFVILASAPQLLRFLPRPGPWLETLKQLFAFPLYATVVWLLWVLGQQVGVNAIAIALLSLIVFALGAWAWARGVRSSNVPVRTLSAALMGGAVVVAFGASKAGTAPRSSTTASSTNVAGEGTAWQPWSTSVVRDARAAGRPVFVDFTAAWCLSCQVNERVALRTAAVTKAFTDANVATVRADWTSRDDAITTVLASFGRSGVPLYVLYPADAKAAPVILPAVLTPGMVVDAITKATASTTAVTADSRVR